MQECVKLPLLGLGTLLVFVVFVKLSTYPEYSNPVSVSSQSIQVPFGVYSSLSVLYVSLPEPKPKPEPKP